MNNGKKNKHMVIFSLKHELDAPETSQFLLDGRDILSAIPGVDILKHFVR